MKKFLSKLRSRGGFTMVELLVVISIIGILAAAVLAALNPAEQLKKGRDTATKSDAATVLSALERYQATFGCYPWANTTGSCDGTALAAGAAAIVPASFTTGNLVDLLTQDELKNQFTSRDSITNAIPKLYMSETNNQVSVCFTPESKTARAGGLGPIVDDTNAAAGTCPATVPGGHEAGCNVCVPQ